MTNALILRKTTKNVVLPAPRLFEKGLKPMQVAAITGHKTLQMLKRYTHLRAEDLVGRLG